MTPGTLAAFGSCPVCLSARAELSKHCDLTLAIVAPVKRMCEAGPCLISFARSERATSRRVANLARLVGLEDQASISSSTNLTTELGEHPIELSPTDPDEEEEDEIKTAGAMAPIEFRSIIGS